jgi:hypothetical protein
VAGILQTEVVIRRRAVVADTVIGVSLLSNRIRHIFFCHVVGELVVEYAEDTAAISITAGLGVVYHISCDQVF